MGGKFRPPRPHGQWIDLRKILGRKRFIELYREYYEGRSEQEIIELLWRQAVPKKGFFAELFGQC